MSYSNHLLRSKGLPLLIKRAGLLLERFGIGPEKIDKCMGRYISLLKEGGFKPTLFATAVLLDRYPKIFRRYADTGAEFACHGLVHTDYSKLTREQQAEHFNAARSLFRKHELPVYGFRSPFLRWNENTAKALQDANYQWSSNQVCSWDTLGSAKFNGDSWKKRLSNLETFYRSSTSTKFLSLPVQIGEFLDIPVSIPDDEFLVDRLGVKGAGTIFTVWQSIFLKAYEENSLYVHLSHCERMNFFAEPLEALFKHINNGHYSVWKAPLQEIYSWWQERKNFSFKPIKSQDNKGFTVQTECSARALPLMKMPRGFKEPGMFRKYRILEASPFHFWGKKIPIIGISDRMDLSVRERLSKLGFAYEVSELREDYELYLDDRVGPCVGDDRSLLKLIEDSDTYLLRFWIWPKGYLGAFSATSDVDAMTLNDFFLRAREFGRF